MGRCPSASRKAGLAPMAEREVLERFEGTIDSQDSDGFNLTLWDSRDRQYFAGLEQSKLDADWAKVGERFAFTIFKEGDEVFSEFIHIPRRELTQEEIDQIHREVEE